MTTVEALANAALERDGLRLRSLVQELLAGDQVLQTLPRPASHDPRLLAIAAAILELLASRGGNRHQRGPLGSERCRNRSFCSKRLIACHACENCARPSRPSRSADVASTRRRIS